MVRNYYILSILLVLFWGLAYPIYKMGLNYTPPIYFAGFRTLFGGLLLSLILIFLKYKIEWNKYKRIYIFSAILNTFLFFGIQTVALDLLPGSLFTVILYTQPIIIVLLAWKIFNESLTKYKMFSLVLGFIGVIIISFDSISRELNILGIILAFITAIIWSYGTIYVKKVTIDTKVDFLWLVAIQSVIGGLFLVISGAIFEDISEIIINIKYSISLFYGVIFGIPLPFIIYFYLMKTKDTGKVASLTFFVPLIASIVGIIFLNEEFTLLFLTGLISIIVSIYLSNKPAV